MNGTVKAIAIDRTISLAFTISAVLLLSTYQVTCLYILLGHTHFILAYVAQYQAGKMNNLYKTCFILLFLALFGSYAYLQYQVTLIVMVSMYFFVHMLVDEVYMLGSSMCLGRVLEAAPIFVLYTALVLTDLLKYEALPHCVTISMYLWGAYLLWIALGGYRPDWKSLLFYAATCVLLAMKMNGIVPPLEKLVGFIILYHYLNWYTYFNRKLTGSHAAQNTYYARIFYLNTGTAILFMIFWQWGYPAGLKYFFHLDYFLLWTVMHMIFCTRRSDWQFLRWRAAQPALAS